MEDWHLDLGDCKVQFQRSHMKKMKDHPDLKSNDAWSFLTRQDQVAIPRMRMYPKYKIGDSINGFCRTDRSMVEQIVQDCPMLAFTIENFCSRQPDYNRHCGTAWISYRKRYTIPEKSESKSKRERRQRRRQKGEEEREEDEEEREQEEEKEEEVEFFFIMLMVQGFKSVSSFYS